MVKKLQNLLLGGIIGAAALSSCSTSQHYVAHRSPAKPKFMGDIYLNPHAKPVETTAEIAVKQPIKQAEVAAVTPTAPPAASQQVAVEDNRQQYGYGTHVVSVIVTPGKPVVATATDSTAATTDNSADANVPPLDKKYADLLGIGENSITNYSLYQFIEKWYGRNYRLGGVDTDGIDCSGFAQKLYAEIYCIDLDRTAHEQFSSCTRLKHATEAREGDLVFFHVHSRRITHVGVYLGNNYFVHASSSQGVVISNLNEKYWRKYFAGCGRVKKNELVRN